MNLIKSWGQMNKKIFGLTSFLLIFAVFFSGYAYAGDFLLGSSSSFDVSIDRATINGKVIAESRTNLIPDANLFSVVVDFTTLATLEKAHVEVILRGRESGNVVSDSTGTFDLARNQSSAKTLTLVLIDRLKRETEFDLTIKIVDARDRSEQKTYAIKTKQTIARGALDVSIDRVRVNNKAVAASSTNFIEKNNVFDVLVEFTALEDLTNAHVEAVLRDLNSGNVVADASPVFNLAEDASSSRLLRLELLDKLKQSDRFELTIKLVDEDGNSIQQVYGISRRESFGVSGNLDISIDSVEVEDKVLAEGENNFIIIGQSKKDIDLDVKLTALENIKNAHVDAILTFENGDAVADTTTTFNLNKDEKTAKSLSLPLISKFKQNSFKLRLIIVDADSNSKEKAYGLKISEQEFPFVVSSMSLSPESNVQAGRSLGVRLSFKNSGVVPLEGLIAKVSIPELDVSAVKFLDQIKNANQEEVREDFILKILDNVQTGTYTVRSEIASQFNGDKDVKELPVFITGRSEPSEAESLLVITIPILKQNMKNDGSEVIYPITLTNQDSKANTYTLMLDGAWANLRLNEANAFVIQPKESATTNIYASTKSDVRGEQMFLVAVKSNDKVLKQIPLKANVIGAKGILSSTLKNWLEAVLIGIVVLLAATGFFFGIKRYAQSEESELDEDTNKEITNQIGSEAYY